MTQTANQIPPIVRDGDAAPVRLWTAPELTIMSVNRLTEAKGSTNTDGMTTQNSS